MSPPTLKDISLKDYLLDHYELLAKLRKQLMKTQPEVCIERAEMITRSLMESEGSDLPWAIRRANALNYFLSNKTTHFFDQNLLAGSTTSKPFGAPVYPEFTGLAIWPELDTIGDRSRNPLKLSNIDAEKLNFEIFPYWMEKNVLEQTRTRFKNPGSMKIFERLIFFISGKPGCISHVVPNYNIVLTKGLNFIIEQAALCEQNIKKNRKPGPENENQLIFYQTVQIVLKGIKTYALNLSKKALELAENASDSKVAKRFQTIAKICRQVPSKPARNFHEAINAIWIIQIAIHAENINMAVSPGRLDQILYPYFKKDIEKGIITIHKALELVGCLWLKLNDNTNLTPEASEELFGGAGTVPAVTIGGVDKNGEDTVNDLTYIILRVAELLQTRDPSLNARYHHKKNNRDYLIRLAKVITHTKSIPAIHNDEQNIQSLENQGIQPEHARDYAIIGCVELTSAGRSYEASSSILFNLSAVLELTLFNGKRPATGNARIGPQTGDPKQFKNYDQFKNAFQTQFKWLAGQAIELNEMFGRIHQEILPTPLLSSLIDGPMENGKDLIFGGARYNSSGVTHVGFADTVDSLCAVEAAVFKDKFCSFPELLNALSNNFSGFEKLHAYLVNRTPKYGTRNPAALKEAQELIRFIFDFYQGFTNYRGGTYRPAYWTMTNHAGQGSYCGALPNGREAGTPLSSGITPVSQAVGDLAACFQAVASLDCNCIPGGQALNIKFPSVDDHDDLIKLSDAINAYMHIGGQHIQFNMLSYETLMDAKRNPEKYPELLVRVSGYSAYFNDLNDLMKDEIISRSEYNLKTQKINPILKQSNTKTVQYN